MQVTIRLFALHREIAGRDTLIVDVPDGSTVDAAFDRACALFPGIAAIGRVAFAVNREHVDRSAQLKPGDELALLPPVAGG